MSKKELVQTAKQLIASPSCCPELKAVTKRWLDAVGTAEEKEDAHALVLELMEVGGYVFIMYMIITFIMLFVGGFSHSMQFRRCRSEEDFTLSEPQTLC